jgi:hypothetical protein
MDDMDDIAVFLGLSENPAETECIRRASCGWRDDSAAIELWRG